MNNFPEKNMNSFILSVIAIILVMYNIKYWYILVLRLVQLSFKPVSYECALHYSVFGGLLQERYILSMAHQPSFEINSLLYLTFVYYWQILSFLYDVLSMRLYNYII